MGNTVVELKNLSKSYWLGKTKVEALKNANLSLLKGDFSALVGPSGSGKSTLLNLIGCIDEPDAGQIFIEGIALDRLTELEKSELRNRKIGLIFQSFNLIPVLNVYENIELPLFVQMSKDKESEKLRILQIIKDVGLEDFIHHRPDQLSGGQRQRVAIARAMVTQPSIILADEPTANLDSKTAHSIIDLLLRLNQEKNVTFLFCSHDEKLVQRVSKVIHIQDGEIH